MPTAAPRPCGQPGCPALTNAGYCPAHQRTRTRAYRADYDRTRLPASQRGYGHTWRKLRLLILREEPLCQWPGCRAAASEVDHIVPLRAGGENTRENLQSLCKSHHSQKTTREDGGWGRTPEKKKTAHFQCTVLRGNREPRR